MHHDGLRRIYSHVAQDNAGGRYVSNQVRTSKYTVYNFLPIGLYLAFRLSTNFYFLIIAVLQSMPLISPLGPMTAIFPLVLVVCIGLLREAIEDRNRWLSDKKSNLKPARVWRRGNVLDVMWENIQVGDILQVHDKENFAADGVVLSTSEENGACLIDTSNLDGEANLKSRTGPAITAITRFPDASDPDGHIPRFTLQCEAPDVDMYKFTGTLEISGDIHALDEQQFIPRGSTLKNTKWAVVIVVYTGHETKMMKNAKEPYHKFSHVDGMVNRAVVFIFVAQVMLCAVGSICHKMWATPFESAIMGVVSQSDEDSFSGIFTFLSFIVLLNTFIPSSLVVSVEIIKTIHANYIGWDREMRNSKGECAAAITSTLVEELGQVKYLFSDKTGTLTQNLMEFRKCSVNGCIYSSSEVDSDLNVVASAIGIGHVMDSEDVKNVVECTSTTSKSSQATDFKVLSLDHLRICGLDDSTPEAKFILAMALCHTVVCEPDSATPSVLQYNADSPDEAALVKSANLLGFRFLGRVNRKAVIAKEHLKIETARIEFDVLYVLAFNSNRKRMSVIVRDRRSDTIRLICKGADCVILERCANFGSQSKGAIEAHLKEFAGEGLRTLCFAERVLDEATFDKWAKAYRDAELAMKSREEAIDAIANEIEQKMTFLATTAIEDKLQDGVPDTIARLLRADVKIWVLTGDKVETAVEIGRSCHVISKDMVEVQLDGATVPAIAKNLLALASTPCLKPRALIIDGFSLSFALMPSNRRAFLQFATQCAAVIVCRMSPLQKALVVELVKDGVGCVTMAVGDGANDISMIRAAHVGVGVMGQEGNQAVRSADFAIPQFRHLDRLLLYHGRMSYQRITQCINYFLYKNVVCTSPQFVYGILSLFSGTTYFSSLYIAAYNLCFTFLPVVARAVLEKVLPDHISLQFPELYQVGHTKVRAGWDER
ncbi:hypothetical protein, variant [Aphanomyces invadans]|uniref:Phospholipid-transporting ATPase n=1 Tax=Aphanomyces invadans TaxID=157072 RepID=A0A024TSC4_9STRA|nr:hypothetical protein, variant [Aphanomyces invadans]ETV96898.1 hypothetical protein, variant [Aphanomyces invadans]|eukprot:XP_008874674.1 hypothetical protein, variant [Aphanomyces invadans]